MQMFSTPFSLTPKSVFFAVILQYFRQIDALEMLQNNSKNGSVIDRIRYIKSILL